MDLCNSEYNSEYISSLFIEYLLTYHKNDLCRLSVSSSQCHHSLLVHFNYLCEFNSVFSDVILKNPEKTFDLFNKCLFKAVSISSDSNDPVANNPYHNNLHIRLTALPVIPEIHRKTTPNSFDIGKFITLRCIVSRVGPIQVLESDAKFQCLECRHTFIVYADPESRYSIKHPRFCPNKKNCRSSSIKRVTENNFHAKNFQEICVHEHFACVTVGVMRRSIPVYIEDDLVESVKPGDDVVVNGVVCCRWRSMKEDSPCEISVFLKANYIENLSELKAVSGSVKISGDRIKEFEEMWSKCSNFYSALDLRNDILRSICPNVYGMYLIKLSLALMLSGAPEWKSSDETNGLSLKVRGSPHILLIGDPGTAKSVLLRGCTYLSERAVLTAATGTTAAGLTAAAIRDSSGWTLDAGALVLADGGLCAIDEFNALHGAHRAAVHEAMEQQTISIAKAGLMARLNCRCSVLAAANPSPSRSKLEEEDFGLPTPLLGRFDLIWRLVDPLDSTHWDRRISDFVLNLDHSVTDHSHSTPIWHSDRVREYFGWLRDHFKPQLTIDAANLLQRYYVWQRKSMFQNDSNHQSISYSRRTLRLMESLVRLTKAHARLMARSEAIIEDAVIVIYLLDASLNSTDSKSNNIVPSLFSSSIVTPELVMSTNIPLNAENEFNTIAKLVFSALFNPTIDNYFLNDNSSNKMLLNLDANKLAVSDDEHAPILTSTQIIHNNNNNNSSSFNININNDLLHVSDENHVEIKTNCNKLEYFDNSIIENKQSPIKNNSNTISDKPIWRKRIAAKLACFENEENVDIKKAVTNTEYSSNSLKWTEQTLKNDGKVSIGFQLPELTDEDFHVDL